MKLFHNLLRVVWCINKFVQVLLSSFLHSYLKSCSSRLEPIMRYLGEEQVVDNVPIHFWKEIMQCLTLVRMTWMLTFLHKQVNQESIDKTYITGSTYSYDGIAD